MNSIHNKQLSAVNAESFSINATPSKPTQALSLSMKRGFFHQACERLYSSDPGVASGINPAHRRLSARMRGHFFPYRTRKSWSSGSLFHGREFRRNEPINNRDTDARRVPAAQNFAPAPIINRYLEITSSILYRYWDARARTLARTRNHAYNGEQHAKDRD